MKTTNRKQITGEQLLAYSLAFPRTARGHGSRRGSRFAVRNSEGVIIYPADTRRHRLCVNESCQRKISEDHKQSTHTAAKKWCEDQGYEVPSF